MIKIVGLRALAVGVIGSFLPMGLGKERWWRQVIDRTCYNMLHDPSQAW